MKSFFKRFLIFCIPVYIYVILVFIIDPCNYFKVTEGIVDGKLKSYIAVQTSNPLYQIIDFKHHPSPYVLLGSSQTAALTTDIIKTYSGKDYKNMAYGGGTLPETITTFWELCKYTKLKEVYIGISFSDFNGSQYRNRVTPVLKNNNNFLSYIFSKAAIESTFLILKSKILKQTIEFAKPNMTIESFWKYQLDVTANRFYTNHTYPVNYYESLKKISAYCAANDIKLSFLIPPNNIELQNKVQEFNLQKEESQFKVDLKKLNDVYDFDYPNHFTLDKNNFTDPFHVKHDSIKNVIAEIFGNKRDIVIYSKHQ